MKQVPDTLLEKTLESIVKLQSTGNSHYAHGLFPSQRVHPRSGYLREDDNIFFSALVVFTLQQLKANLPDSLVSRIDTLIEAVVRNYPNYRHPANPNTYNFWHDRPDGHFPNGLLLNRLPFFALPADADDTALIYLTSDQDYPPYQLKATLENHYSREEHPSPLTPVAYRDLRAYPTFLGKKVQREMDVCVMSNVLYLVFRHQLPLTQTDQDSIEFVRRVLVRQDYRKAAFQVAPNYSQTSVILYHIARLIAAYDHHALHHLKDLLVSSLHQEYQQSTHLMDRMLLASSLLRFQISTPQLILKGVPDHHFEDFYFFRAGMLTSLQRPALKTLSASPFFHLKFRCVAYYLTLYLEYQMLYQQVNQGHPAQI